jgi:uncharacterized oxidoreductase
LIALGRDKLGSIGRRTSGGGRRRGVSGTIRRRYWQRQNRPKWRHFIPALTGIEAIELDVTDAASIDAAAKKLLAEHPDLNVLINNAGIMEMDQAAAQLDDKQLVSTVATNLLGPIRLTSTFIDQLKRKHGIVIYNTSVLAFVPLAMTAVYSATKAALHSYAMSQRFLLRDSGVRVLELAPPWVRTELMNSQEAEQAMPLDQFIAETLQVLETDADEILVEAAKPLRANPGPQEHPLVNGFNQQMVELLS